MPTSGWATRLLRLKILSKSEKNYAQIEKELLAIVFGCKKYRQYIHSKTTIILTDHKSLEFLFKKQLSSAPPRLQNYDLQVEYRPGKGLVIAKTLSRAPSKETDTEDHDVFQVHTIAHLPVSVKQLGYFRVATEGDNC